MHTLRENESWAYTKSTHRMNRLARNILTLVCEKAEFFRAQRPIWVEAKNTNQAKIQAAREKEKAKNKTNKQYDIFHTSRRWTGVTFHCMEWIFSGPRNEKKKWQLNSVEISCCFIPSHIQSHRMLMRSPIHRDAHFFLSAQFKPSKLGYCLIVETYLTHICNSIQTRLCGSVFHMWQSLLNIQSYWSIYDTSFYGLAVLTCDIYLTRPDSLLTLNSEMKWSQTLKLRRWWVVVFMPNSNGMAVAFLGYLDKGLNWNAVTNVQHKTQTHTPNCTIFICCDWVSFVSVRFDCGYKVLGKLNIRH